MSNKETVEKINASFQSGSTDGFLEYCTDDVSWAMVGEKTVEGKETIREWMKSMTGMEPPQFTVDQLIADGDNVACYGDMKMKGEDGKIADYSYCDVYHFKGDKVAELRSFVVKHKDTGETSQPAAA